MQKIKLYGIKTKIKITHTQDKIGTNQNVSNEIKKNEYILNNQDKAKANKTLNE